MAEPSPSPPSPPPSQTSTFSLTSHETALALLPPHPLHPCLDRLRALYDAAYPKWPPHLNQVYPFDADETRRERVKGLREIVLAALGGSGATGRSYRMHLTMAQSEDVDCAAHRFLVGKIGLLPPVEWQAAELAVLVRERDGRGGSVMRLWGRISLKDGKVERLGRLAPFYKDVGVLKEAGDGEADEVEGMAEKDQLQTSPLYCAGEEPERWTPFMPSKLVVASYNVLAEFEWPPSEARYPLVVNNILAENAHADVLVLQEVTDGFLSYLLSDKWIREAYPFCTHGPPHEDGIEPLPSYLNIVITRAPWSPRSNMPAGPTATSSFRVVVAAVHLSHGLGRWSGGGQKDRHQTGYRLPLRELPWAPMEFWRATSTSRRRPSSINTALKNKAISDLSLSHLANLDGLFDEAKLVDAWKTSTENDADDSEVEGEQGATWDPTANGMAAAMAAGGGNTRPQRYDRILVRGEGFLKITNFNMFGFLTEQGDDSKMFASDHWGVRCSLDMGDIGAEDHEPSEKVANLIVPVHLEKAPEHLAGSGSVEASLRELGVIPSADEVVNRKKALDLLKSVILDAPSTDAAAARSQPAVIIVPVAPTPSSPWQPSASARPPPRASGSSAGSAPTPAPCSRSRSTASSPWRDTDYLARSLPDPPTFRLAHRAIKTWAKSRGIYAARFGFLSGIQISILLARVHKLLTRTTTTTPTRTTPPTPETLLTTFFTHYATFDWAHQLAFDPFFHRHALPYTRTPREPLAVLGYFAPARNTALAASVPSTKTLAAEFRRAADVLRGENGALGWAGFLGGGSGAKDDFLAAHRSYVKLDVQYWGDVAGAGGAVSGGGLESRCVMLLVGSGIARASRAVCASVAQPGFVEVDELGKGEEEEGEGEGEGEDRDF
ncbi:hypothetical protein CHGG_04790 [Chaetomium globosum CBS 148.51]|uniref:polynucleotide adenylyltransferase n=1 Tax=Chaetomium globosum (strain ATCC 6205 / CBS 148.51 / DSM 1962 / NBRC 6347 / NRRL 1970) TaxID=306901 RepID=Q2H0A6_CHAGB|nr:uncharacterized protein CHGG_04790 [Chaetomium globosum CBS 148.51]EAQ88171.1 hypothetical protein CHGG_04790 [Chaetomium globosum CBS 148.51]